MIQFTYTAKKPGGGKVVATREALDAKCVAAALRDEGLVPIEIKEVATGEEAQTRRGSQWMTAKPRAVDVLMFVKQLSAMLRAGVNLVPALDALAKQSGTQRLTSIIESVRNSVLGGMRLSTALRAHPEVFNELICAMVSAGEESGNLDGMLTDLAAYLHAQRALRRKVKTALTYPAFIGVVFGATVIFLLFFLLPRFQGIFDDMGKKLPTITVCMLALSAWLRAWSPVLLGVLVGAVMALRLMARKPKGRYFVDQMKLRIPIIGPLALKVALVRFLETLSALVKGGSPILMAMDVAADTANNKVVEEELQRVRVQVSQGSFISREMSKSEIFPDMMVHMISVGEETGSLSEQLQQAALFYKEDMDSRIEGLTALIEPVLIVFMGGVVDIVVLSVYLPIFNMSGGVG